MSLTMPDTRPLDATSWSHHEFRAMGTDIRILVEHPLDDDAAVAIADGVALLRRLAATFTRFDARSELRELERRRALRCSPELLEVVERALDARRRSDGRFDPTVHDAMLAIGYDRTFDDVLAHPRPATAPVAGRGGVLVDPRTGLVALSPGASLDLGGIAKGWIADRVAERLARLAPALVDAGGDIACTPRANDAPWNVEVAGSDTWLELAAGGVATSGVDRRRWTDPGTGRALHHVIDPDTGMSADTDLRCVTVVSSSCADAEVAATAMLVGGSAEAPRLAKRMGASWWCARDLRGRTLEGGARC